MSLGIGKFFGWSEIGGAKTAWISERKWQSENGGAKMAERKWLERFWLPPTYLGTTRTTVDYFQMLQTSDAVVISNNLRWCPFCISDIIYSRRSVKIFPFQNPAAMMDYFFIRFTFRRICPCHNCFIFLSLL